MNKGNPFDSLIPNHEVNLDLVPNSSIYMTLIILVRFIFYRDAMVRHQHAPRYNVPDQHYFHHILGCVHFGRLVFIFPHKLIHEYVWYKKYIPK